MGYEFLQSSLSVVAWRSLLSRGALESLVAFTLATSFSHAAELDREKTSAPTLDLLQLDLEDLGKLKVTSVSRKTESVLGAAAAIQVITQEDIRRSGVNSVPEALRLAPGLDVARANSREWAISSRGFNQTFANKLLVLMDGRTIYTPLFSGVFWEETDTVLEDIDRIEVIRGPGAALWGANAVNGVINIITRGAEQTQGLLISGGGGVEEQAFGTIRYGGTLGTNAYYRVYGKYAERDRFTSGDGADSHDGWWMSQEGFRVDWMPSEINRITLQGDYHYGELGGEFLQHRLSPPGLVPKHFRDHAEGQNILGRWTHNFSPESEMSLQMYYDRADRGFGIGSERRDTFDIDAQHRFQFGDRNEVIWGGGYRYSTDKIGETPDFSMRDPDLGIQLVSGFVEDSLAIVPDKLRLTLGAKIEHNDFTGFELQPNGRLAWTPNGRHTVWAAVSRAVRTPSRVERGFSIYADPGPLLPPLPLPILVRGTGNPDLDSEKLLAYEIGYRVKAHPRLSLDVAAFYNEYDQLESVAALPIEIQLSPSPYILLPLTYRNELFGETYGVEVSATWQPFDNWRLRANYTLLQMRLHTRGEFRSISEDIEGDSPQQQIFLSSDVDLGRHFEWGMWLRYVDRLTAAVQQVPAYTELEMRLAWKPTPRCEIAIIGNNLLHAHHREFSPLLIANRQGQVDRAIYGKVTFRF